MRAAASATDSVGSPVTADRRTRAPTGVRRASGTSVAASVADAMRRRMLPITKDRPACVSSTGSAAGSGTR